MLVGGTARINGFLKKHATVRAPMARWIKIANASRWKSIIDVRKVLPTADAIGNKTCFNIGGGNYRLLTVISYERRK